MANKIIILINRKTGVHTITYECGEGGGGTACLEKTKPLEDRLGMREPQREMLPEFYQQVDQVQDQEAGGA